MNTDFMSYAMLALANNSKETLLNLETYVGLADKTFGTFFKHFVSVNASPYSTGNNVYQPIGEHVPCSLAPVIMDGDLGSDFDQGVLAVANTTSMTTEPYVNATLHSPAEQLVMSPLSVFLCISLLAVLILITLIVYTINHDFYKVMPRDVDNIASILALVYASENLLNWVRTVKPAKPWYRILFSDESSLGSGGEQGKARLGPFRSADGTQRWGVGLTYEISEASDTNSGLPNEEIEMQPLQTGATDEGCARDESL
jgi:hypothetical protein